VASRPGVTVTPGPVMARFESISVMFASWAVAAVTSIVYGTVGFSGTAFTAACTLVYSAPLLATVKVTPGWPRRPAWVTR
jgi:hypothetical protein